jgi:hypothetical protein
MVVVPQEVTKVLDEQKRIVVSLDEPLEVIHVFR